jgi:cobalt transporter subunit CbtB
MNKCDTNTLISKTKRRKEMERVVLKEKNFVRALLPALLVVGVIFSLVIIAYGMDSVVPGVHDTFHDFRHAIGMPCH